jgi:hypothetical protein
MRGFVGFAEISGSTKAFYLLPQPAPYATAGPQAHASPLLHCLAKPTSERNVMPSDRDSNWINGSAGNCSLVQQLAAFTQHRMDRRLRR